MRIAGMPRTPLHSPLIVEGGFVTIYWPVDCSVESINLDELFGVAVFHPAAHGNIPHSEMIGCKQSKISFTA